MMSNMELLLCIVGALLVMAAYTLGYLNGMDD